MHGFLVVLIMIVMPLGFYLTRLADKHIIKLKEMNKKMYEEIKFRGEWK